MTLILGIAGAAAALVILYNRLTTESPEVAAQASRRVHQLAAVVLVLAKAVEGLLEALQSSARPAVDTSTSSWSPRTPASGWSSQPRPLVDVWEDYDDDR